MEKKLILLGVLRNQDMHGYQLSDHLEHTSGMAISLSKANAYRLLAGMEADGWVTYREEQEGNRPPRRVYTITAAGEQAFQNILRESLGAYLRPQLPGAVALNYLDSLPQDEAVALLEQRREGLRRQYLEIDNYPEEVRHTHEGIAYLHRFFLSEMEWLEELIARLKKGTNERGE